MSRIEPSDLAYVASLARLALSEDEIASMTRDLEQLLEYVASLDALDTEGVAPTEHTIDLATPMRADVPGPPMDPERVVAGAPAREGTAFLVPKVLEEEG
jgi:aspartyl-tRNA(Asn)/glutamyl-tRNA(Gln) amidotransferase subunit C